MSRARFCSAGEPSVRRWITCEICFSELVRELSAKLRLEGSDSNQAGWGMMIRSSCGVPGLTAGSSSWRRLTWVVHIERWKVELILLGEGKWEIEAGLFIYEMSSGIFIASTGYLDERGGPQ